MNSNWKNAVGLLVRAAIVAVIVIPIGYFLSIRPGILLLAIVALIGLWEKRKQLPSIIKRTGMIIVVILVAAILFGFIGGGIEASLGLFLTAVAVIVITVGLFDDENPKTKQADSSPADSELIPEEKQQVCPNCGAIISQDATLCSLCGKSVQ